MFVEQQKRRRYKYVFNDFSEYSMLIAIACVRKKKVNLLYSSRITGKGFIVRVLLICLYGTCISNIPTEIRGIITRPIFFSFFSKQFVYSFPHTCRLSTPSGAGFVGPPTLKSFFLYKVLTKARTNLT